MQKRKEGRKKKYSKMERKIENKGWYGKNMREREKKKRTEERKEQKKRKKEERQRNKKERRNRKIENKCIHGTKESEGTGENK